jgi:serine/threonine-protein kinase
VDATLADPLVGQLLDGRYRVSARIARGGMATVYQALDTRLERTVALKVMHAGLAEDHEFVSRFIREAKSAARLSHPNAVAVFDQGTDGGRVFLTMEHIAGRTLRDLLHERDRLSPGETFDILEPVLAALGAAHQANLVHRDVKPENVLIAHDGRIKVADFGLARAASTSANTATTTGVLIGTVAYLSPEQVERGVADARSDVYAAGIMAFEMLTGDKPFTGATPLQIAFAHVHDVVPAPSSRVPGLPPELDALLARATDRDPDGRPTDANQLLAEVLHVRRSLTEDQLRRRRPCVSPGQGRGTTGVPVADRVGARRLADGSDEHDLTVAMAAPATGGAERAATPSAALAVPARDGDTGPISRPDGHRRPRGAVAFALMLLLASGLSVAAWWFAAGPGAFTTVPSVLNQDSAQARDKLEQVGLRVKRTTDYSETVAADLVKETRPGPNERVKKTGSVTLVVSRGPERFLAPSLAGLTPAEAEALLADRSLQLGTPTLEYSDTVPEGHVIGQDVAPDTELRRDAVVGVVVSRGVEPIEVPGVAERPLEEARATLAGVGLTVQVEREEFSRTVPKGNVISQVPPDGTLPKGSAVSVVLSAGPPLVAVPNVLDRKVDEARAVLEERGFIVETEGTRILDRVFSQTPSGGQQAPEGSTITLRTI